MKLVTDCYPDDGPFADQLTIAQRLELDNAEVVQEVDGEGWALTKGGVWIDKAGVRHYGP